MKRVFDIRLKLVRGLRNGWRHGALQDASGGATAGLLALPPAGAAAT